MVEAEIPHMAFSASITDEYEENESPLHACAASADLEKMYLHEAMHEPD